MYEDGARYEGQLEEGLPNGWGLLREFSRHFLGRFRGGLPHGIGVLQVGGAWGERPRNIHIAHPHTHATHIHRFLPTPHTPVTTT